MAVIILIRQMTIIVNCDSATGWFLPGTVKAVVTVNQKKMSGYK